MASGWSRCKNLTITCAKINYAQMLSRLKIEIDSFLARDPAAKSRWDVVFSYPGFHALAFYRLANFLWGKKLRFFARWVSQLGRFFTGIEIHPAAKIGEGLFIDHGMGVVIGETAKIGNNVTIYHGVTLGGVSAKAGIRHPQIGDDVIIGSGAALLGAIEVGEGARIGSNAVVVKNVPAKATMVGVPARNVSAECKGGDEFAAYGMSADDVPDMVMKNFEVLTKRIAELENELKKTADSWKG